MADILLVEDDQMIASGLVYALEQQGYVVIHCTGVSEAMNALHKQFFKLAILDMQLLDGTGFDISKKINMNQTAVIFLTVVDDEGKIVQAFEQGAVDYVTKPFRLREFLARVNRTMSTKLESQTQVTIGNAMIDTIAAKVYVGDEIIELTALEYRLLLTFAMNKGILLSRRQILENIWDQGGSFVEDNTLTVYMKRLREKMSDAVSIETVRGRGYRAN